MAAVNGVGAGDWSDPASATTSAAVSSDASLSGLSLSDATLTLADGVYDYTATVENSVLMLTITATATHDDATVAITPADAADAAGHQVSLAAGDTTITVTVTAEDRTTTRDYTVTVTRADPAPEPTTPEPTTPEPTTPEPTTPEPPAPVGGGGVSVAPDEPGGGLSDEPEGGLSDEPGAGLSDLGEGGVHEPGLRALAGDGVFEGTGCGGGRLCPREPLPRWEMAVWLVRILDGADPESGDPAGFSDVDDAMWWAPHVRRLAELGVTEGCSQQPARFCGDEAVTRALMASFLARALDLAAADPAGFEDTAGVHAANIDALFGAGITVGCGRDPLRYCPQRPTSRAHMATFLHRALEWLASGGLSDLADGGDHEPALRALAGDGVFDGTGCGPGRLCPREPLLRWEMAVWLVRILDGADPESGDPAGFSDVDDALWWAPHVRRLAELGVTEGCSQQPARFCGDEAVTRALMASFLARALDLAAADPAGFDDTEGSVHAANIDALFAAGITRGCATDPPGFCPDRPITRAQMAAFLNRARNR